MEKDHFEILLEEMRHNFQLAFEGLDGVNQRLDRLESNQTKLEGNQAKLELSQKELVHKVDRLEAGQEELQDDVKDIKRSMGILLPIAKDHESRIQALEETIRNR